MTNYTIAAPGPLKLRRLKLGYSQQRLAALAGLSRSHISMIEGGHSSPMICTARRLATALNCDLDDIFPPE